MLPVNEGGTLQWYDLRGFSLTDWPVRSIRLVGCILDSTRFLHESSVIHQDCWAIRVADEGEVAVVRAEEPRSLAGIENHSQTEMDRALSKNYEAILVADDFGINPASKNYIQFTADMPWM